MKKIVLFGAGKIGRAFIGQVFSRSGWEVVFVDISREVIDCLNLRGCYRVVFKSDTGDRVITVDNVRGILSGEGSRVAAEIAECDLAAVSVGKNALRFIAPLLAEGVRLRYAEQPERPLDVILAENMRDAAEYMTGLLEEALPEGFPVGGYVGLVESSIGKMVPIMPAGAVEADPLTVYAEPYNTLIVDKKAFLGPLPDVGDLAPKENIRAWVDRKSYIHNFGHAAAAYCGNFHFPDLTYMYQVLEDQVVRDFTRAAMKESAAILMAKYPGEFTAEGLDSHIEDLLARFANRALGDTVFRVGTDLERKLHISDRILSPFVDGVSMGLPVGHIGSALRYGLQFRAVGPDGRMSQGDIRVRRMVDGGQTEKVLSEICGLDLGIYGKYLREIPGLL